MNTFEDLMIIRPDYLDFALSRLLPDSEPAYMTQEMGFYDLHPNNVGLPIRQTMYNYEYGASFNYRYSDGANQQVTVDFNTLVREYDRGRVGLSTPIELVSNDRWVGQHLRLRDANRLLYAIDLMNRGELSNGLQILDKLIFHYTTLNGKDRSVGFRDLCRDYAAGHISDLAPLSIVSEDRWHAKIESLRNLRRIIRIDYNTYVGYEGRYTGPNALYNYSLTNGTPRANVPFETLLADHRGQSVNWNQITLNNTPLTDFTELEVLFGVLPGDYHKHYDYFSSYSYSIKGIPPISFNDFRNVYISGQINDQVELTAVKSDTLNLGYTSIGEHAQLKKALQDGTADAFPQALFSFIDNNGIEFSACDFRFLLNHYQGGRVGDDMPLTIYSQPAANGEIRVLPGFRDLLSSKEQLEPDLILDLRDLATYRYEGQNDIPVPFDQLYNDYKAGRINLDTMVSTDNDDIDSVEDLQALLLIDPNVSRWYESLSYTYTAGNVQKVDVDLDELVKDHEDKLIDGNTTIAGRLIERSSGTLNNFPNIANAVREKDELVLFDTDRSFPESNRVQRELMGRTIISMIPWRSTFLATEVRDLPLSEDLLLRLRNRSEEDLAIRETMLNRQAPIRRFLPEDQTLLNLILERYFRSDDYSLNKLRAPIEQEMFGLLGPDGIATNQEKYRQLDNERKAISVGMLKDKFARNVSNLEPNRQLWEHLQDELVKSGGWFKPYQVREDDTWMSIASIYHLDVEELKRLNPTINNLAPGQQLRVRLDLTAETRDFPSADWQRQQIAKQLFPNYSWGQYQALVERQECRTEYLNNYQVLSGLHAADQISNQEALNLVGELERIVRERSTPISQFRREAVYLPQINQIRTTLQQAASGIATQINPLIEQLKKECQPSYFNMGKAMFPLVADLHEINLILLNNNPATAVWIGDYSSPIEQTIDTGLQADPNSELYKRTRLLQQLM
jgi:hypothetical protein